MWRIVAAGAVVGGACADLPATKDCQSATDIIFQDELDFNDLQAPRPPLSPIAVGGSSAMIITCPNHGMSFVPVDFPFEARMNGRPGITLGGPRPYDNVVPLIGGADGSNQLEILYDGTVLASTTVTAETVTHAALVPLYVQIPTGQPLAISTQAIDDETIEVRLDGTDRRVIDDTVIVSVAGMQLPVAWQTVDMHGLPVGTWDASIQAGDQPAATFPLTVTNTADAITVLQAPAAVVGGDSYQISFAATFQGNFVVGLLWTYTVDGVTKTGDNTLTGQTNLHSSGTSIAITAAAGGQSISLTLPVQ